MYLKYLNTWTKSCRDTTCLTHTREEHTKQNKKKSSPVGGRQQQMGTDEFLWGGSLYAPKAAKAYLKLPSHLLNTCESTCESTKAEMPKSPVLLLCCTNSINICFFLQHRLTPYRAFCTPLPQYHFLNPQLSFSALRDLQANRTKRRMAQTVYLFI